MPHTLILHYKVKNYRKFKANFAEHLSMRKLCGEKSYQIFHKAGDIDDLVMLFEWDKMENLQKSA